jgi:hypothetical protein
MVHNNMNDTCDAEAERERAFADGHGADTVGRVEDLNYE